MRTLVLASLTLVTFSAGVDIAAQESLVQRCESAHPSTRADENQPMPDQLELPDAPKTARSVACFSALAKDSTMVQVVKKCGIPDKHLGSGIYIFGYYMSDCSIVSVGTPDLKHITVKHVKHGKTIVLFDNWR